MTQSTWGNMLNQKFVQPKEGYALHHLEHVGENPMYAQHMQAAFKVNPAKIGIKPPKVGPSVGSPWQSMNGRK